MHQSKFIRVFRDEQPADEALPIWLMRQAGRYLPEYKRVRSEVGGFLDLCYTPDKATEVTLQPIDRFDLDAAILFSDILIVPHALGQPVRFVEGEGPRLDPIHSVSDLPGLAGKGHERFALVCEAVSRIRDRLAADKSLIGFCGAPYTVATYMIAGKGSSDQAETRKFAFQRPDAFAAIIDCLVDTSILYLSRQIDAGVNAIQIFDSWAGPLPDDEFERWVVGPTKRIVDALHTAYPDIPVIGFPRGAAAHATHYVTATGVDGLGCDTAMPLAVMAGDLGPKRVVRQGNLDPLLLMTGGEAMDRRIRDICSAMRGRPFIFNLGHGILQWTPPDHVSRLVDVVRGAS